jgi:uncharacterized membrane protein
MSIDRPFHTTCVHRQKLCAVVAVFLVFFLLGAACTRQQKYAAPTVVDSTVVVEVSSLQPETPRFFTYRYDSKNINFFVLRMNTGVQSYLDACASCYPHKLGYRCEGGSVVCKECRMKFSVYKLEKGIGGCYPIRIEGRAENGKYLIPLAALEAESGKF